MRTLKQRMKELSPDRRKKVQARAARLVAEEMTLQELRRARKLTQVRMAKALRISQDGVSRLEKRTAFLALLANVAMLAGLLGTIVGLIQCFAGVAGVDASEKARVLSDGISEAMNCTAFGLVVAIPALVAFSLLQGRTQHMIDDINETSVGVLNLIVANKDKMRIPANLPQQ